MWNTDQITEPCVRKTQQCDPLVRSWENIRNVEIVKNMIRLNKNLNELCTSRSKFGKHR